MDAKKMTEISVDTTLVIFTCENREHLITRMFSSFNENCNFKFKKVILVIDGKIDVAVIAQINPDIIVQHTQRTGYVNSIIRALKNIDTEYYFWLEDDFIFNQEVPLNLMLKTLTSDNNWAGIFLSREAPLTPDVKAVHLFDNLYVPYFGFSVSPTLCRTAYIREAFDDMIAHPKEEGSKFISFEPYITESLVKRGRKYAILDPGAISHVTHFGQLESTAREYHMINSISIPVATEGKDYISGLHREKQPTFYNKVGMFIKLYFAVFSLSVKLFFTRQAYDFAFRVYVASLRRFRY